MTMNGLASTMLDVFGRFFPEQFKAATGMTTDEFKQAYNPNDKAFCARMKERYDAFEAANPAAKAQADDYMRQGMSHGNFPGAGAPVNTKTHNYTRKDSKT